MEQRHWIIILAGVVILLLGFIVVGGDLPSFDLPDLGGSNSSEMSAPLVTVVVVEKLIPPCEGTEGVEGCYNMSVHNNSTCVNGKCPDDQ